MENRLIVLQSVIIFDITICKSIIYINIFIYTNTYLTQQIQLYIRNASIIRVQSTQSTTPVNK
jgi:hypothetical protein